MTNVNLIDQGEVICQKHIRLVVQLLRNLLLGAQASVPNNPMPTFSNFHAKDSMSLGNVGYALWFVGTC